MGDYYMSRGELLSELEQARTRIAELEKSTGKALQERMAQLVAELELANRRIAELENVAEAALQRYDDYFRIHFSLSDDVLYSYDNKYSLRYVSPNVERILGYKPEEIVGRKIFELLNILDPMDHEEALEDAFHAMSGHTNIYSIYRFIAKDGSMRFGEVSGVPLTRNGRVVAVVSVAREVRGHDGNGKTNQKNIRQKTDSLCDRLSAQVLLDTSGIVLDLNEGAAQILGKSRNELKGSSIFLHTPESLVKRRRANFERIRSSGLSDGFIEEYKGRIYYNTLSPICDEKGSVSRIEMSMQELSGKKYTNS